MATVWEHSINGVPFLGDNLQEPLGRIDRVKNRQGLVEHFNNHSVCLSVAANLDMIDAYDRVLTVLEQDNITTHAKAHDPTAYAFLLSIRGVGWINALNLLYEIEDISRFPRVQDFASYCRLVTCVRESNGKKYGSSGRKIGNAHLRWAFSLAAQLFLKGNEPGKKLYEKLVHKHGKAKALSILAHKLGRAVYFMLKNRQAFDMRKFLAV